MRIATNVSAIVSNNALQKSQDRLTKSIARLSSGYKLTVHQMMPQDMQFPKK